MAVGIPGSWYAVVCWGWLLPACKSEFYTSPLNLAFSDFILVT